MGWTNKITNFFTIKDSDMYCAARDKMCNIRENISDVLYVLPDVTIAEMVFIKNKWQELPSSVGENVKIMALDIKKNVKTIFSDFGFNSQIYYHEHLHKYEFMYVCDGSITVITDNETRELNKGECVLIPIGSKHSVKSNGASVLTCFSDNPETAYLSKEDVLKYVN